MNEALSSNVAHADGKIASHALRPEIDLADRCPYSLGEHRSFRARPRQKDAKFFSTKPADQIDGANAGADCFRDRLQGLVALFVAKPVVDHLEMIDVDDEQSTVLGCFPLNIPCTRRPGP